MIAPPKQSAPPSRGQTGQRTESQSLCATKTTGIQAGSSDLSQFIRDMLSAPPRSGDGMHRWLFKVARQLHAHRDTESIVNLLALASEGCGRVVSEREIREAVVNAGKVAWQPSGNTGSFITPSGPRWPVMDAAARQNIIEQTRFNHADLWHASPVPCTWDSTDAEFFVDQLFPGNPLLCVGLDQAKFWTAPREEFRRSLSGMSLVVPSPMTALTGKRKKDGKESPHTLENTGPRRYLVIEQDTGNDDEQTAVLWHLREFAPLVLVTSSGGKSLHGWFNCQGIAEDMTRRFMRYTVSLGADPATWTRSQFVRLPQGWRADKQARQSVSYFDPAELEGGKA